MPLIEDRFRPSSMAVASRCTTAPIGAVPAIGGTGVRARGAARQGAGPQHATQVELGTPGNRQRRLPPAAARPRPLPGTGLHHDGKRRPGRTMGAGPGHPPAPAAIATTFPGLPHQQRTPHGSRARSGRS